MALIKKLVINVFFKIIPPRSIERNLKAQGYSKTAAKEIISSFKRAVKMCV